MKRLAFLVWLLLPLAVVGAGPLRPNIIFMLADDLGYGDIGCYGQKKIRTPNIDRLAEEGMRFTAHYSGNNVCAPARCVLMTGLAPGARLHPRQPAGPGVRRGAGARARRRIAIAAHAEEARLHHGRVRQVGPGAVRQHRRSAPARHRPLLRLQLPGGGTQLLSDFAVGQRHAPRAGQSEVFRAPETPSGRRSRRREELRGVHRQRICSGRDRGTGAEVHSREQREAVLPLIMRRRCRILRCKCPRIRYRSMRANSRRSRIRAAEVICRSARRAPPTPP